MLAFPLLLLSSSVLLPPPTDNLLRLCPKLLLYRGTGAGLGELESEEGAGASGSTGEVRVGKVFCWPKAEGFRASAKALSAEALPRDPLGDEVKAGSFCCGEADSEGDLNGMNDTDGLLPIGGAPSADRRDDLDP